MCNIEIVIGGTSGEYVLSIVTFFKDGGNRIYIVDTGSYNKIVRLYNSKKYEYENVFRLTDIKITSKDITEKGGN